MPYNFPTFFFYLFLPYRNADDRIARHRSRLLPGFGSVIIYQQGHNVRDRRKGDICHAADFFYIYNGLGCLEAKDNTFTFQILRCSELLSFREMSGKSLASPMKLSCADHMQSDGPHKAYFMGPWHLAYLVCLQGRDLVARHKPTRCLGSQVFSSVVMMVDTSVVDLRSWSHMEIQSMSWQ